MTGQSLGFVVIETTRREGRPDDAAVCVLLPGSEGSIFPDEGKAGDTRNRLAAHAAIDADIEPGVTYAYSVAEVVSRG